jgi:hypothetical protein
MCVLSSAILSPLVAHAKAAPPGATAEWGAANGHAEWTDATFSAVDELGGKLWEPGFKPVDIADYCPGFSSTSAENRELFWVGLLSAMAREESGFNPDQDTTENFKDSHGDFVISRGLLQLSVESANQRAYGCDIKAAEDLHDAATNLRCAVRIMVYQVTKGDGRIAGRAASGEFLGAAAYWGSLRTPGTRERIAAWTRSQPYCAASKAAAELNLQLQNLIVTGAKVNPTAVALSMPPAGTTTIGAGNGNTDTPSLQADDMIVRYIGVDTRHWKPMTKPISYADLYTRVQLTGREDYGTGTAAAENPLAKLRDYKREKRPWLARILAAKADTVTTVANVEIADPALKVAIPLFSVSHSSGPKLADTWDTNFTASNYNWPLFRLGPNTTLTVNLHTSVTSDVKSQGASLALGAIIEAVKVAAPASTLLTPLSRTDVANTAGAIDGAVSALFSNDITETIQLGRLAQSWSNGSYIQLTGCAPFVRDEGDADTVSKNCAKSTDIDGGVNAMVGQWELMLACPRLSVFDARDICSPIGDESVADLQAGIDTPDGRAKPEAVIALSVSDTQILGFNLSSQVTVQSFILAQTWYSDFIAIEADKKTDSDYVNFCAGGAVGLENNGLNAFDAALAIRAATRQLPKLIAAGPFAAGGRGATCATFFAHSGVPASDAR